MKTDRISCLCITQDRVLFLKRSIECFKNQSYKNKELLIFYIKTDKSTKEFSESILANKVVLSSNSIPKGYKIDSIYREVSFSELFNDEEVMLVSHDNLYLSIEEGSIFYSHNKESAEIFKLKRKSEQVGLYSERGFYLNFDDNKIDLSSAPTFFWPTTTLEDTILFLKSFTEFEMFSNPLHDWSFERQLDVDSSITFIEINSSNDLSLGFKRNLSVNFAKGKYICIWDDDDIYHRNRLHNQLNFLRFTKKYAVTLASLTILNETTGKKYRTIHRSTGWEGSLMCKREKMGFFASLGRKEDTPVLEYLKRMTFLTIMDDPDLYCYCVHSDNISGDDHLLKLIESSELIF